MAAGSRLGVLAVAGGVTAGLVVSHRTGAAHAARQAGIRQALGAYNAALNGGRTADVLPLYTPDGVFMAPFSTPAIGTAAIASAYDSVFRELAFDVAFTIEELVVMSAGVCLRAHRVGGTTHHASSGKTTSEANQELFVMRKDGAMPWRIAPLQLSPIRS